VSDEAANQMLPTIVLIGGQLTLTDGSVVDSRQPAADEKTAEALQTALIGCVEWWSAVSSIVVPTLDDPEGGFAIILGQRSIVRASLDGETRRSRLSKFLRGAVGSVSAIHSGMGKPLPGGYRSLATFRGSQGSDVDSIGVRFDDPMPRWCFVDGGDYFLRLVVNRIGARVIIDTTGGLPACEESQSSARSIPIDYCVPSACPYLIVVPDTAGMRGRVRDLLAGRLDPFPFPQKVPELLDVPPYEPREHIAPADFLRFPVVRAECSVSGLLREGHQWGDAAGLEAARMLLLNRFDLKLGLWDLALNPVLRSTVLDSLPVQSVPEEAVQTPAFAWKQAERRAEEATARRDTAQRAILEINATLLPVLAPIGWSIFPIDRGRTADPLVNTPIDRLWLPLTEPLGDTADALVDLTIRVNKSSIHVVVSHALYEDIDISAFIEEGREAFEAVGLPPVSAKDRTSTGYPLSAVLWTANVGWRDTDADWSNIAKAIADHTKQWVALLADFTASCREVWHAKYDVRCLFDNKQH
jgi:hypothetical protein